MYVDKPTYSRTGSTGISIGSLNDLYAFREGDLACPFLKDLFCAICWKTTDVDIVGGVKGRRCGTVLRRRDDLAILSVSNK